ncbi:MAG: MFS transporter, partial [Treponema sp.]|nr:MFS transporter [Treponema sp.]
MKYLEKDLKNFYILWSTQSVSQLGSAMTAFALTLWLYEKTGSALSTAALTICTYAPYVLMSIFAGAISDKFDKKKTMLTCDSFAALCTVIVFVLYKTKLLSVWHLYAVNALSGLMNTVQQPASEVAYTLITP